MTGSKEPQNEKPEADLNDESSLAKHKGKPAMEREPLKSNKFVLPSNQASSVSYVSVPSPNPATRTFEEPSRRAPSVPTGKHETDHEPSPPISFDVTDRVPDAQRSEDDNGTSASEHQPRETE